jgi:hypoxanthine phosphoribosyltransferase
MKVAKKVAKSWLRQVHDLDGRVLSKDNIDRRCHELALRLTRLYARKPFTIVAVLNGAVVFAADLLRPLSDLDKYDEPVELEFVKARSYQGTESGTLDLDLSILSRSSIEGRHVVLVDDILDTGQTLFRLIEKLREWNPESIRPVVMLKKDGMQKPEYRVEFDPADIGFVIPPKFVVGRGLDYDGRFRNLNWIAEYVGPKE